MSFVVIDDIMRSSNVDFDFTIKDTKGISYDESELDLDGQTSTITIDTSSVSTRKVEPISNIAIYPNPTSEQLYVASDNELIQSIEIYNVEGQLLQRLNMNQQNYILKVANFAQGVYVVHIRTLSDRIIQRFVKF